jgi:adenylate cyclase
MVERAGSEMAERTRVMHLFGRYVAPEVRDEVVRGEAVAEVRECTVLFTDLRDFTSLAERVTPRELLDLLNAHFAELIPIVHRHGGTVNKFVGDALMATFGAPIRMGDHAAAAVRAGVEMLKATDAMNERLRAGGRVELMMGVGIATGPVVVGNLGALERQEYAVLGDTVNTAARMESANKETGTRILMSEATAAAVGAAVALKPLGALKVKGKTGPLAVFTPA